VRIPFRKSESNTETERERAFGQEVRSELSRFAAVFVERIADPDAEVCRGAMALMSALAPVTQDRIVRRARELFAQAGDEAARVDRLCLLAQLDREAHADLLRSEFSSGATRVAKLAAAIELAILQEEVPSDVARFLTETFLAQDEALIREYSRLTVGHAYWPTVALLIAKAGGEDSDRCLPLMCERVEGAPWADHSHLRALMALAFARHDHLPADPSDTQKRAVLALAVKSFARLVNLQQPGWPVLGEFRLPTTRDGIDAWLGLPDDRHPGFTLRD
jgi:hypothetical protein